MESKEDVVNLATHYEQSNLRTQPTLGNHQLVIVTQLLRIAGNMHHIDELFLWLSHMLAQRLKIDVIQFWALQPHFTKPGASELRATVYQDMTLPQQVVVNTQVVEVIEHLLSERRGVMPQPVSIVFPQPQASMLTRYRLNYWASYFLHSNALLPPPGGDIHTKRIAIPLTMIVSLFLQQPFSPRLLPTTGHILEQAISIARNHGLLIKEDQLPPHTPIHVLSQQDTPTLADLVPQRNRSADAMQASNPFSNTVIIPNKQARYLYGAIDGRRTVAQLLIHTRLDAQDFYTALHLLLKQQHIQLEEPGGQLLSSSQVAKLL